MMEGVSKIEKVKAALKSPYKRVLNFVNFKEITQSKENYQHNDILAKVVT